MRDDDLRSTGDSDIDASIAAYLASALTGLRHDERAIVDKMSDALASICMTAGIELYQPRAWTDPVHHPEVPDFDVFRQDAARVTASDIVLAIADYPSTGLGQELIISQQALVPVILVSSASARISRMVSGMPGLWAHVQFTSTTQLPALLMPHIDRFKRQHVRRQREIHSIGRSVQRLRRERGWSQGELAARVIPSGILSSRDIDLFESSSDGVQNPSHRLLTAISAALGVRVAELYLDATGAGNNSCQ